MHSDHLCADLSPLSLALEAAQKRGRPTSEPSAKPNAVSIAQPDPFDPFTLYRPTFPPDSQPLSSLLDLPSTCSSTFVTPILRGYVVPIYSQQQAVRRAIHRDRQEILLPPQELHLPPRSCTPSSLISLTSPLQLLLHTYRHLFVHHSTLHEIQVRFRRPAHISTHTHSLYPS